MTVAVLLLLRNLRQPVEVEFSGDAAPTSGNSTLSVPSPLLTHIEGAHNAFHRYVCSGWTHLVACSCIPTSLESLRIPHSAEQIQMRRCIDMVITEYKEVSALLIHHVAAANGRHHHRRSGGIHWQRRFDVKMGRVEGEVERGGGIIVHERLQTRGVRASLTANGHNRDNFAKISRGKQSGREKDHGKKTSRDRNIAGYLVVPANQRCRLYREQQRRVYKEASNVAESERYVEDRSRRKRVEAESRETSRRVVMQRKGNSGRANTISWL